MANGKKSNVETADSGKSEVEDLRKRVSELEAEIRSAKGRARPGCVLIELEVATLQQMGGPGHRGNRHVEAQLQGSQAELLRRIRRGMQHQGVSVGTRFGTDRLVNSDADVLRVILERFRAAVETLPAVSN